LEARGNFDYGWSWFENNSFGAGRYHIDFTTYYALLSDVPELVRAHFPDPKLICILREPVNRFVSHYYQYVKMGIEVPSLDETISSDGDFSKFMVNFSKYGPNMRRYTDVFGADSLLTIDFRDVVAQPEHVCHRLENFLNIEGVATDDSSKAINPSGRPIFGSLQKLLFSPKVRQHLRKVSPQMKTRLLGARKAVIRMNTSEEKYPALSSSQRILLEERLADSIQFYAEIFGSRTPVNLTARSAK